MISTIAIPAAPIPYKNIFQSLSLNAILNSATLIGNINIGKKRQRTKALFHELPLTPFPKISINRNAPTHIARYAEI